MIIDCFSRYTTLHKCKSTGAEDAAKALLDHMSHYGVPCAVKSDQGSQFVNGVIKQFLDLVGTEHVITIAYSKEENALVERANREVMEYIRDFVYDKKLKHGKWSDALPHAQWIHNARVVESIGQSPADIIFGPSVNRLDYGLVVPMVERVHQADNMGTWLANKIQVHDTCIQIAQETQKKLHHAHMEQDFGSETVFENGSYVLLSYPPTDYGMRRPSKLHMMHQGPYKVISKQGNEYTIENLVTGLQQNAHCKLLRVYNYDVERTDPRDIALRDYKDQYYIERVISHTGQKRRPGAMKFKVKWLHYDEITDEPYVNVKFNEVLHEYLRKHGMESLIPASVEEADS